MPAPSCQQSSPIDYSHDGEAGPAASGPTVTSIAIELTAATGAPPEETGLEIAKYYIQRTPSSGGLTHVPQGGAINYSPVDHSIAALRDLHVITTDELRKLPSAVIRANADVNIRASYSRYLPSEILILLR